jgi:hypothetical protein
VRRQLEDDPTAARTGSGATALCCSAIQVSRRVEDEARKGHASIGTVRERTEVVQHAFCPASVRIC